MYDDEDDDDEIEVDAETTRREGAEVARGKEDRAFYDGLAKKEDERHNAMRKDVQKRSLAVGELRQKLRHKETELHALAVKIRTEEDRIEYEKKKAYRRDANAITAAEGEVHEEPIPILTKDIGVRDIDEEFSVERAVAHIKQLQEEKNAHDKVLEEMLAQMHEEERALSQLQHSVARM